MAGLGLKSVEDAKAIINERGIDNEIGRAHV